MTIPHLDEEALSAALDDEATAEEQAHLAGCRDCRAGVARLAAVARAVARPVPPRPRSDVTAAVDRALAGRQASAVAESAVAESAVAKTSGRATGPGRPGPTRPADAGRWSAEVGRRSRTGPARWGIAAAGLAAAVLVAAALVGIVRGSGGSAGHTTSAIAPVASPANGSALAEGSPAMPVDLGEQSDPVALTRTLHGLLTVSDARAKAAGASTVAPAAAAASTVAPAAAAGSTAPGGLNPSCVDQGRVAAGLAAGSTESPSLVGSARWRGEPAVVLVYRGAAGPGGQQHRPAGVIMRTADCARLALLPL